jgi:hypothetical protein
MGLVQRQQYMEEQRKLLIAKKAAVGAVQVESS